MRRTSAVPAHLRTPAARLKLGAVRLGFALGGRLFPAHTVARAGELFTTPFSSSRTRAEAARPDAAMQRGELDIDGQRIAIYTWGDPSTQPYALLAHGWSSFGLRYLPWVAPLRALGLAVVAFDQPGHGFSAGRTCTLPDFVRTLNGIGRRFGPADLAIGHSMGGAATVLAQDRAWHARRLVLLAPAMDWRAAADRFFRLVRLAPRLHQPFLDRHAQCPGVASGHLQMHHRPGALAQPALVIHDRDDSDVPWEEGERFVRHWPGARLLTTRGLGHHRVVDDAQVIEATLAFLRGEVVGRSLTGEASVALEG